MTRSSVFAFSRARTRSRSRNWCPGALPLSAAKGATSSGCSTIWPSSLSSSAPSRIVAGLGFGRDGSYRYYMSEPVSKDDPKATGPFILAAVELERSSDALKPH